MKAGVVAKMVKWWRTCWGDCSVVGVVAWLVVVVVGVVVVWGAKLVAVMVVVIWSVPK